MNNTTRVLGESFMFCIFKIEKKSIKPSKGSMECPGWEFKTTLTDLVRTVSVSLPFSNYDRLGKSV